MLRSIVAVLVGFGIMVVIVMAVSGVAMVSTMGTNKAGAMGEPTLPFLACMVLGNLVAAIVGGWVAAFIAGASKTGAVRTLASIVLILGLIYAVGLALAMELHATIGDIPKQSAEQHKDVIGEMKVPLWYLISIPFVGAAGVLVGGWLRGGGRQRSESEAASGKTIEKGS